MNRPLFVVDEVTGEIYPIPQGGADVDGGDDDVDTEPSVSDTGDKKVDDLTKKEGAWRAQLPDELKDNEAFSGYKKLGDMAKDYLDLKGKTDGSIKLPGDDATDEQWAEFYQKVGRPAKADDYNIAKPDLPAGIPYDKETEKVFKNLAHEVGLTQGQAEKLYSKYYGLVSDGFKQEMEAEETTVKNAVNTLKNEWKGEDFNKNTNIAVKAYELLGNKEALSLLDTKVDGGVRLGNHPAFIKLFHRIGTQVIDDNTGGLRGGGGGGELTDEDMADKMFPSMKDK